MKPYIVTVPGLLPYIALARSSCEAIMQAIAQHGARCAGAKPA